MEATIWGGWGEFCGRRGRLYSFHWSRCELPCLGFKGADRISPTLQAIGHRLEFSQSETWLKKENSFQP